MIENPKNPKSRSTTKRGRNYWAPQAPWLNQPRAIKWWDDTPLETLNSRKREAPMIENRNEKDGSWRIRDLGEKPNLEMALIVWIWLGEIMWLFFQGGRGDEAQRNVVIVFVFNPWRYMIFPFYLFTTVARNGTPRHHGGNLY